jgi:hypothetical protein
VCARVPSTVTSYTPIAYRLCRDTLEGEASRFVAVFNRKIETLEQLIDGDDEVWEVMGGG